MADGKGITWLASYPKSGNTWLRCLLESYRRNGLLDINDIRICSSDGAKSVIHSVSPLALEPLGMQGELLLRPAALLNLRSAHKAPFLLKTHFANLTYTNSPPCIPPQVTDKAIYVVRDPRCVLASMSKHFNYSLPKAADKMNDVECVIGGTQTHCRQWTSSWTQHVASWIQEDQFPILAVKYEELVDDAAKMLHQILEFLDWEIDEDRIARAVEASHISRLQQIEDEKGFCENGTSPSDRFFNNAGTDWRTQIGTEWAKRIEDDHGKVMRALGYLEDEKSELTAVS